MTSQVWSFAKRAVVGVATAAATAAGLRLLGLDPWSVHDLSVSSLVSFLFVAGVAGLSVALDVAGIAADPGGWMRLPFVASMTALLLRGPVASTLAAGMCALAGAVLNPPKSHALRRIPFNVATAVVAAGAAALAFARFTAMLPQEWPWPSVAIVAAVTTATVVACAAADFVSPLLGGCASAYRDRKSVV